MDMKSIFTNLGLSIAAVILAAGIVVALDYSFRPATDANGNPVVERAR